MGIEKELTFGTQFIRIFGKIELHDIVISVFNFSLSPYLYTIEFLLRKNSIVMNQNDLIERIHPLYKVI